MHIPKEWEEAAGEIVDKSLRVILVLGVSDTGKSTFTRYLANQVLMRRRSVAIVDADVGQSSSALPTTIALGVPDKTFHSFSEVSPRKMYFVGSTSPLGHLLSMLGGTKLMLEAAAQDFVIIDTTGLIRRFPQVLCPAE